jgi:orotate phosphoribosyltransferase
LLEIKAVSINAEEPFKYTSGLLSPIYTDNRLLISYPEKWHFIIDSFINVILNIVGLENIDVVAGTATSGIPHAALISDKLALPLVYVKIGENGNGHGTIEGRMGNESRAVMVEDHITTGKSVISAVETLRAAGARVDWCTAIFTYGSQVSKDKFKEAKLDLITLCDLATLLKVAVDLKHITEKDRDTVLEWLDNPESWSNKRQST